MTLALFMRRIAAALALALSAHAANAADAPAPALPTDSIYQLAITLQDQDGRSLHLADKRGRPLLVSMFYTSCQFVCPMLIDAARATEAKLDPAERERLPVLLVSFDPERDSVAVLARTARSRHLDRSQWTLARASAGDVRKLAAVLGIQYRRLPDGDFNHTTALILLDRDGRVASRTTRLGDADPAFVEVVKASLQAAAD
ncbi:MAG: SCO family protein [Burkholderiales bacterium]|nr:SCO family protein [Burkholderiales bacterium]MDE2456704.1 SCO family protein [Burkholderiales bacterium]